MDDDDRLLRRQEVEALTALSRSSLYKMMRADSFPASLRVGPRAVRWRADEVRAWLAQCPRATGEGRRLGP